MRTQDVARRTTQCLLCETACYTHGIPSAERRRHRRSSATWRMRRIGAVPSRCRGRSPRHEESATEGGYFVSSEQGRPFQEDLIVVVRERNARVPEWKRVDHEGIPLGMLSLSLSLSLEGEGSHERTRANPTSARGT